MFRATKAKLAVAMTAAAVAAVPAATADAQTRQEGLVNVSLTDINVPIGVAANVCNVSANVLAANNFSGPFGDCDAIAPATATGGGNGNTRQNGLVNVSVSDLARKPLSERRQRTTRNSRLTSPDGFPAASTALTTIR